jgi:Tfp pilus assembly protein PilF
LGKNDKAALLFDDYLKYEPKDAAAMYSYGLLLSEIKQYDQSMEMLLRANTIDPERPRVAHNIAMMYEFKGDILKAELYLKKERALLNDYNSQAALLQFYLNHQMNAKALQLASQMEKDFPESEDIKQVAKQLRGY